MWLHPDIANPEYPSLTYVNSRILDFSHLLIIKGQFDWANHNFYSIDQRKGARRPLDNLGRKHTSNRATLRVKLSQFPAG